MSQESCIERINTGSRQIQLADQMICALPADELCQVNNKYTFGDNNNQLVYFYLNLHNS
jgi:hypothetical protein